MKIKRFAALCAIFALCFNSPNRVSGADNLLHPEESEEVAYQKLLKMEKGMMDSIKKLIDQVLPILMNSNSSIEISGPCMGSILKMIGALKKMHLWPFQMLDAIGKPPGGIMSGTSSALGSYRQCIDIVIPTLSKKRKPDVGKYCVVELGMSLPPKPGRLRLDSNVFPHINAAFESEIIKQLVANMPVLYYMKFILAVCLPSSCTIDDLNLVLTPISIQTGLEASVKSCQIKETLKMDVVQIAIVSALCFFVLVNILSTTIYEVQLCICELTQTKPSTGFWFTAISYFSMRPNFIKLIRTREATPRSLEAINGIKVITMLWIILGHCYVCNHPSLVREIRFMADVLKDVPFQVVMNSYVSVSTFFFLAAVLLSYNVVRQHDAGKSINPFILYFRRCYRFTPVLLIVLACPLIIPFLVSGPLYKEIIKEDVDCCRTYWWRNLLFIQNFFSSANMCALQTWYLAVDIQCFIVGLLYLFILFKNEASAKLFLVLSTLGCCAGTAYVTYVNDFPPTFIATIFDKDFMEEFGTKYLTSPLTYLSLYCVGLFLGTYMARAPKIQINKFIVVICWLVSFAMGLTVVYAIHPWNSGEPYTTLEAISYSSLHRLGWAIAIGWVVFACFSGRGGVINDFLSWPGFQPLVRLSYIVYLIHGYVLTSHTYGLQGLSDITNIAIVFNFLGTLVISHIIAVFIRVMYEYPLLKIEDDAFKWFERRRAA